MLCELEEQKQWESFCPVFSSRIKVAISPYKMLDNPVLTTQEVCPPQLFVGTELPEGIPLRAQQSQGRCHSHNSGLCWSVNDDAEWWEDYSLPDIPESHSWSLQLLSCAAVQLGTHTHCSAVNTISWRGIRPVPVHIWLNLRGFWQFMQTAL